MIWLYSGTPGSGKSYHALKTALDYYRRHRLVVANFPVRGVSARRWVYAEEPTVGQLVELALSQPRREGSLLLVLDEAARQFNSRDWQAGKDRMRWITFFSQHRKLGYDIVLVSQHDRMLDRQIRANVEMEVKHMRANRVFVFRVIPWPVFMTVEYWYHAKFRGRLGFMLYAPWVGHRYDHMAIFSGLQGSDVAAFAGAGVGGPRDARTGLT